MHCLKRGPKHASKTHKGVLPRTSTPFHMFQKWGQRLKKPAFAHFLTIILIMIPASGLFAQQSASSSATVSISKMTSALPKTFQAALPQGVTFQQGSPILRTAEHIGGKLMLAPSLEGVQTIINHISSATTGTNLIIEALVFLPSPALGGSYSASSQIDALGLLFNQFRSLQGIQYWSASRKIMRTLYTDAFRVDNPNDKNKIKDPETIAEFRAILPQKTYIYQKDQTFSGIITEVQCAVSQTTFLMTNTNVTPLRLIGIPVLSADGIRTGFLAAPSPEGVFLYFVTSIKSPSIGRDRVFESASNKALALLHWFTEAASARSIIEPVHLPWNIDDLPPEIRLKQAANNSP